MDDLVDVCKAQAAIGVDIYIANSQEIPSELNEDFLLIDDNIFTKVKKTGDGRSRAERTSTNHIEISEKNRNFDMLLQYSEKLEDFLRRVKA